MLYTFAPNNFNYVTCNRCFYLMYKHKIKIEGGFPALHEPYVGFQSNQVCPCIPTPSPFLRVDAPQGGDL